MVKKKLMETGILLIKMNTFHIGKPGNVNSLRERGNLNYSMTLLP